MGAAIQLRGAFDGPRLRQLAKRSWNVGQARRLLALAEIYDGRRRGDAARLAGVGLQIIRDSLAGGVCAAKPERRVDRFNAEGPDGLINRKGSGPPSRLNDRQRAALWQAVEDGPRPYLDGPSRALLRKPCRATVVRWRLVDLVQWVRDEIDLSVCRQTLGRELRTMGFRRLTARPQLYAQDPEAMEAFKKTSPIWSQPSG